MLFRLIGQDVEVAHDGAEAITRALEFKPDLILLDIGMPRMDGYEVCRRIRQEPTVEGAVVVALTGWGDEEDRRLSRAAGFDNHLVKPVDPTALQGLIDKLGSTRSTSAS
jgi:CheY-like chemotaxis protein